MIDLPQKAEKSKISIVIKIKICEKTKVKMLTKKINEISLGFLNLISLLKTKRIQRK